MKRPTNKPKLRYSGAELVAVLPESSIAMILVAQELTKLMPMIAELHQATGNDEQAQALLDAQNHVTAAAQELWGQAMEDAIKAI